LLEQVTVVTDHVLGQLIDRRGTPAAPTVTGMDDGHDQAPLTGEELLTWSALATVLEWLPAALDAQLQEAAALTHFEFGVLYALLDAPDHTLRMSVLAGHAHSSLTRLSRAVTRLERREWVRRVTDPVDGRYTLAVLTELGKGEVQRALPGHAALVRRLVLQPLTRAQTRQLQAICRRIQTAIRPGRPWVPASERTPEDEPDA
jgi:DNA-binding MarR family transcriptional regulator